MIKKNKKSPGKWMWIIIIIIALIGIGAYFLLTGNGGNLPQPPVLPS